MSNNETKCIMWIFILLSFMCTNFQWNFCIMYLTCIYLSCPALLSSWAPLKQLKSMDQHVNHIHPGCGRFLRNVFSNAYTVFISCSGGTSHGNVFLKRIHSNRVYAQTSKSGRCDGKPEPGASGPTAFFSSPTQGSSY